MSEEVEAVLLAAKQAHPHWGPRKIRPYLARHRPDLPLPAPSTAGELFQRAG
jgi:putative transposase